MDFEFRLNCTVAEEFSLIAGNRNDMRSVVYENLNKWATKYNLSVIFLISDYPVAKMN